MALPEDGFANHRGVTFDANLGIGTSHTTVSDSLNSNESHDYGNSHAALAGAFGVGGWLSSQISVSARIAGVQVRKSGVRSSSDGTIVNAFFGPSVQYWKNPNFWIGAGAGFATLRQVGGNCTSSDNCAVNGFGLEGRASYSFPTRTANAFNISVEFTTGFYNIDVVTNVPGSTTTTGGAILIGYQYL